MGRRRSTGAIPRTVMRLEGIFRWSKLLEAHGRLVTLSLRLVICYLLATATLGQYAAAKPRINRAPNLHCEIGLADMKSMVDRALGSFGFATATEKAFLHLQHQRMSCEEYTRLFENSDFYRDEKKRKAVSAWHWRIYHAADDAVRDRTIRDLEPILADAQ